MQDHKSGRKSIHKYTFHLSDVNSVFFFRLGLPLLTESQVNMPWEVFVCKLSYLIKKYEV